MKDQYPFIFPFHFSSRCCRWVYYICIMNCPYCNHDQSHHIGHNTPDAPRFRCKKCGRSFTWRSGSSLHHIKKRDVFVKYRQYMLENGFVPLYKMCQIFQISLLTAFDWRHKVLSEMQVSSKQFRTMKTFDGNIIDNFTRNQRWAPAEHINGAKVLQYAFSGQVPFGYLESSDKKTNVAIFGIAICQYESDQKVYCFSCNANWDVVQDSEYNTLSEAIGQIPPPFSDKQLHWHRK